jgi:23S rRNA pseudouridine1911/1915/1917 synthase
MDYRPLGGSPRIVDETESYAVLYKPPLMFSAPLGPAPEESTLLGWYGRRDPPVIESGGGLLHRLDFETEGLVLLAKTRSAYESLRLQQAAGDFVKEYLAAGSLLSPGSPSGNPLPGFPPPPLWLPDGALPPGPRPEGGAFWVESFFRPWGPGRKAVRPVTVVQARNLRKKLKIGRDRGACYRTELLALEEPGAPGIQEGGSSGLRIFSLQIRRGFRHQIRCHLAWIGAPILYDALYGWEGRPPSSPPLPEAPGPGGGRRPIALRARGFRFFDPATGARRNYRLP